MLFRSMKFVAEEQTWHEKTQAERLTQLEFRAEQQAQKQDQQMKILADEMKAMILTSLKTETADSPNDLAPLPALRRQTTRTPSPTLPTYTPGAQDRFCNLRNLRCKAMWKRPSARGTIRLGSSVRQENRPPNLAVNICSLELPPRTK